ncbi:ABC transporter [Enterobacter cloacae]|uniref:ABC transporter n=1 Tax=Enterobacter cloacae TaxID=550 RepID=A0A377M3Z6_ENTCL|nr:ABC transporter [Enterobacter cloacae]
MRVILTKEATEADIRHAPGMPDIEMEETAPRFEDAFIDLLGGSGYFGIAARGDPAHGGRYAG